MSARRMSAAQVAESQRWRLLRAGAEVLFDRGYTHTTSRAVSRHASVSSSAFYEHFEDLDACLLAGSQMTADCLWDLITAACMAAGEWRQRLRLAVEAAIGYVASEPYFANLLGPEAAAGIAEIAAIRERLLRRLAGLLCSGRQLRLETAGDLPPALEQHLLGGSAALLADRIAANEFERLPALTPQLTEILTRPFRDPALDWRC